MKLKQWGHVCFLCGKEIRPDTRFARDGEEAEKVKIRKGPTRYLHRKCYDALPKVGDR